MLSHQYSYKISVMILSLLDPDQTWALPQGPRPDRVCWFTQLIWTSATPLCCGKTLSRALNKANVHVVNTQNVFLEH